MHTKRQNPTSEDDSSSKPQFIMCKAKTINIPQRKQSYQEEESFFSPIS